MYIADLHIHSKYSRATSGQCVAEYLDFWARRKGIELIGTGDFTHPAWRGELKDKLIPAEDGLYTLRRELRKDDPTAAGSPSRFVITGEISSIYKKDGKVRKVHNLILLPGLEAAEELSRRLEAIGNIHSDGRPILGLDSRDLLEITMEACPEAIFIPAHIWTPHFSMFGAFSDFDTIEECFGDMTPYIHALETGLSSDPPMNWRLSALDGYTLVSNSDAHSPAKLGREANLIGTELSYPALKAAIEGGKNKGFIGTLEFFPEEGKYHLDGHRNCNQCLSPLQTQELGGVCPVCGKKITIGVLHRVEQLADRPEGYLPPDAAHFESLAPLPEAIAASTGRSAGGVRVAACYEEMLKEIGPEFYILREAPLEDIGRVAGACVQEGIRRLRCGQVERKAGYDGEYGVIGLLSKEEIDTLGGQISLSGIESLTRKRTEVTPKSGSVVKKGQGAAGKSQGQGNAEQNIQGELNERQREAVEATEPIVAVVAGPGTGKTRTLVSKIAHLIQKQGVKPSQIMAVTFTNQAADELRKRIGQIVGSQRTLRSMRVGTFHSLCLEELTKRNQDVFVVDEYDALDIAAGVLKDQGSRLSARRFLREVSKYKNGLKTQPQKFPLPAYESYCEKMRQLGALDFDDLLLSVLNEWEDSEEKKGNQLRCPQYLLVDEFQDINPTEYRLVRAWSRGGQGLFVIGDPDQSIYGFRGSSADCFAQLLADEPQTRRITLVENYRSTPQILDCALPVISHNDGEKRGLEARRASGSNVKLIRAPSDLSEAIFVAKQIAGMVGGMDMVSAHELRGDKLQEESRSFSDFAVLYRTHRQADLLEMCLKKEGIPYTVGGRDDFLADNSVRAAVSFFRFLLHPGDILAGQTCLKLAWACPKDIAEGFASDWAEAEQMEFSERLAHMADRYASTEATRQMLQGLRDYSARVGKDKPQILLEHWMRDYGLAKEEKEEEPVTKLLGIALLQPSMQQLLNTLLLGRESDVRRAGSRYASGAVRLMTLHGAKGLEFPVVFLCGLTEGTIPLERKGIEVSIEEERRLFYVGMTRAQQQLYLLTGERPSAFLAELGQDHLDREETGARTQRAEQQLSLF